MAVPARISLITLGVGDVERAVRFYEDLGRKLSSASVMPDVAFIKTA